MKIVQISDVHIRNLKYHKEYREVFADLYKKLDEIKPDRVVNTGDTAHTKTQISPEFVQMASEHFREVRKRVDHYDTILGNHDLNLMNPGRQDAISPIVESLRDDNLHLYKKSGRVSFAPGFNYWVFSLADQENYPTPADWRKFPNDVNIGLFHGSVSNCVTDSNWRMTHVEHDLSIFDGLDFVFMGDIHKQQFFSGNRIAYPGSLIQQNFGEEIDKGFLLWDIKSKTDFTVTPYTLKGGRKFITLRLNEDLSVTDTHVGEDNRLRIVPPRQITLVEQKAIEKEVKRRFKPHDVITLSATNVDNTITSSSKTKVGHENLREIAVQEKLLRDFFASKGIPISNEVMQLVLDLNRRYQIHIDQKDDTARNVSWKFNKVMWSNLFNYGEGNVIDFSQLGGLTGLFAPNASGKSNLIDVLLETCFDATTKGVNKNIFLINDNKENAVAMADISANDQKYTIERTIERIKYGQRSRDQVKEWGKTSVSFAKVDEAGQELLAGTLRPETERNIRQRLGTFDDFLLTSLSAQWNPLDIISCKETKRREILYKFLDLDICEQKVMLAKEESKPLVNKLKDLDEQGIDEDIKKRKDTLSNLSAKLLSQELMKSVHEATIKKIDEQILELSGQKVKIETGLSEIPESKVKEVDDKINLKKSLADATLLKLVEAENAVIKLDKLENRFDLKEHQAKKVRFDEVNREIDSLANDHAKVSLELSRDNAAAKLLQQVPCGDSFPTCKFLVNAFESKNRISELSKKEIELASRVDELNAEKEKLRPYTEKLDQYNKFVGERTALENKRDNIKLMHENQKLQIKNLEQEKEQLLEKISRFKKAESDFKKNEELDDLIADRQTDKRSRTNDLKTLQVEINSTNKLIGTEQGALDKLLEEEAKLSELRNAVTAYEHYMNAMGKDGIPYQILTQKLPLINEEINKILSNAADFSVFIEHDQEEQSIRLYLQYGQYKSRLLELGSGAEKFLASIAIRNALLNISNLPKTNIFIIDEGFGKLDLKNLEAIQRMFDYLKSVFDHVWIISHLDVMKDLVDNVIEITVDDEGYAHVEVGS
jgi:DNA repair exonuclease SbcCD ATPase subunit